MGNSTSIDSELSRLWKCVCTGSIEETTKDGFKVASFTKSDGIWTNQVQVLLVRKWYEKFYESLYSGKLSNFLILGTPGVGKSLFSLWLIYKIATDSIRKNKKIPTIAYQNWTGQIFYLYSNYFGTGVEPYTLKHQRTACDYYVSDTSTPRDPQNLGANIRIHISSAHNENYKKFRELIGEGGGMIAYLDVFSIEECLALADINNISYDEMRFRHHIFGGSARNLIFEDKIQGINGHIRTLVEDAMNEYFLDQSCKKKPLREVFKTSWENAVNIICNSWEYAVNRLYAKKTYLEIELVYNSLFMHKYVIDDMGTIFKDDWASDFMKWLAAIICEDQNSSLFRELMNLIVSDNMGAKGIIFERRAHISIFRNLSEGRSAYHLTSLDRSKNIVMSGVVKRRVYFRTIEDISELQEGDYGKAITSNFPDIDALIRLNGINYLLQMTVDLNHEGKKVSAANIKMIQKKLQCDSKSIRFVYVVSNENYDNFSKQNNMGEIKQYKLLLDILANEMTYPKRRRILYEFNPI